MFDFLTDGYFWLITSGTALLGMLSGTIGTYSFLKKQSLLGDVIAHSVLPGIALAYLIGQSKSLPLLLFGGTLAGSLSSWLAQMISKHSKIKSDGAFAINLGFFFALGLMLVSYIQSHPGPNPSGLNHFLFGNAAALSETEVQSIIVLAVATLILITAFYRPFFLSSFNPDFAQSIGIPVKWAERSLHILVIITITLSIQSVGVVMAAALLITPAAAARMWTHKLPRMMALAAIFGGLSGIVGTTISYHYSHAPTGPWVVLILSFFAVISILYAPKKGIWALFKQKKQNQQKIREENILKFLLKNGSRTGNDFKATSPRVISNRIFAPLSEIKSHLKSLVKQGLLVEHNGQFGLNRDGKRKALHVIRLHRLWELYLSERMNLPTDHVHNDAEAIEHIITPEIEAYLVEELGHPTVDPHNSVIPKV